MNDRYLHGIQKIGKWDACISIDTDDKEYIITSTTDNGAVISDKDLEAASKKFIEAMELGEKWESLRNAGLDNKLEKWEK